ncbi:nitroreductase family protein [Streptomyces dysideae]|uniref:Nitroreductase n=1 Tax=Streptomyces dysideae TaxID=909626 RepID=A0A101V4Z7_9ACTN|nr:hypothetical protein [Streptomyces dysideae]KUO22603.1 hypothetical protein AQJ91_03070 [Streptomyces dysideae]
MTATESEERGSQRELPEIAAIAARAANAHNTQPWDLRYRADHIEVGWRTEYALGPSDPSHRDLRLSLGTYVETLLISAAEAGVPLEFEPDYDAGATRVGRLWPAGTPRTTPFTVSDIEGRRVWRGPWSPRQVDLPLIGAAQRAAREAGFRVAAVPTASARPLLVRAYHWFFGHAGIAAELLAWTRLNPRQPEYRQDGLNDVMLVLNRAERTAMRVLFAPLVYRLLRPLGLVRLLTVLSSSATSGDGWVLVILGKGSDPAREVEAGRLVTRLWLQFFQQGVYVHPQSHVIDCPGTVDDLAELCGAEDGERPLVFFRVGFPATDPAVRPRHPRREEAGAQA